VTKKQHLTRAEIVRRRRAEQAQKPSKKRGPRPMPPVTARAGAGFAPPNRKRQSNVRRRYEIALNPSEARLHAPALPAIHMGWRWVSALLSLLLVVSIYLLWTSPYFMVAEPVISGNQRLSAGEISSVLGLNGQSIFLVTPRQLERNLRHVLPELASASVTVSLPNRVSVVVSERQPLIAWQQDGGVAWIDADGIAFRPRGQVEGLITIAALGRPPAINPDAVSRDELSPPPFISTEMVAALQALAPYAPAGAPIVYDPQYGLGWNDPRGWTVHFGQGADEVALKIRIYQTMVDWLAQQGIHPVLISVAYPHAPFYRLEQ